MLRVRFSMGSAVDGLQIAGVSVRRDTGLHVASLRYFDAASDFAAAASSVLGGPLPAPLRAVQRQAGLALAWRSPTETLLLADDVAAFADIRGMAAAHAEGCLVEQTGGIWGFTVVGARASDLLLRLGSTESIPAVGEARTGRLAELSVMSLCLRPGEIMLLVERLYAAHLQGWIRETLADL